MAMQDARLEALQHAHRIWQSSNNLHMTTARKLEMAKELYEHKMFSLNQLAKIVRLPTVYLTREGLTANAAGGRFDPSSLTTLIAMRKTKILGERCPARLIEVCVEAGTSWSCAATLTGIAYSNYYKNVPQKYEAEVRQLKLKPHDKDAIVKALRAKANYKLLAAEYGIHPEYIWEIKKAYGNV